MLTCTRSSAALAALLLVRRAAPASAASFYGLGDLAGDDFYSFGYGMSGDGAVVVGESHSGNGTEAFRWSGAMSGIGDLPLGIFDSSARGVSDSGSVVVGFGNSATGIQAFRYDADTAMMPARAAARRAERAPPTGSPATASPRSAAATRRRACRPTSWLGVGAPVALGDLAGGAFRSQALARVRRTAS